jgi:hypothetical protein
VVLLAACAVRDEIRSRRLRVVSLICGLIAAAVWLGVGRFATDLLTPFLALWRPDPTEQLVAQAIWYGVPAFAVIGGIAVLGNVYAGAVMLVLAAGGWFAIGSLGPSGPDLASLVPMGLALFAAVLAILGRHRADPAMSAAPSRREEARVVASREFDDDRSRSGRGFGLLVGANALLTLVVAAAIGGILYRDYVIEGRALPWSGMGVASVLEPAQPVQGVANTPSAGPGMVVSVPTGQAQSTRSLPSLPGAQASNVTTRTAAAPAQGTPTADVFSYCRQVDTIDYPDYRYAGPPVPAVVTAALGAPPSAPADRVRWRCLDGAVLACATYDRPVCAMTPSVGEMLELCARMPNAQGLLAPAGMWRCDGTRPVIPTGENWPVDARGFLPGAWRPITPSATNSG